MPSAEQDAIDLLGRRASATEIGEFVDDAAGAMTLPLSAWLSIVAGLSKAASSTLDWLPSNEERKAVRGRARRALMRALLHGRPDKFPSYGDLESATESFTTWISTQSDYDVVKFCWSLLAAEKGFVRRYEPVFVLHHSGRLSGEISLANIELALSFHRETDEMFSGWKEERWELIHWQPESERYYPALAHHSYLVRGSAAQALGGLYIGCLEYDRPAPPTRQMLEQMADFERRTPGIAGPFLFGAHWAWEAARFTADGFDVRHWFLETLRTSGRERDIPGSVTLEFPAHELFAGDAAAIREMLAMGRRYLAFLTATQDPSLIESVRDVLEEMVRAPIRSWRARRRRFCKNAITTRVRNSCQNPDCKLSS